MLCTLIFEFWVGGKSEKKNTTNKVSKAAPSLFTRQNCAGCSAVCVIPCAVQSDARRSYSRPAACLFNNLCMLIYLHYSARVFFGHSLKCQVVMTSRAVCCFCFGFLIWMLCYVYKAENSQHISSVPRIIFVPKILDILCGWTSNMRSRILGAREFSSWILSAPSWIP